MSSWHRWIGRLSLMDDDLAQESRSRQALASQQFVKNYRLDSYRVFFPLPYFCLHGSGSGGTKFRVFF